MTQNNFQELLQELNNIEIDEEKLSKLETYYNLLIEWNNKINLTAITDKEQVYIKHFYDSLTLSKIIDLNEIDNFCDIGTGAGFPGIVIKIFFPHIKITLIDSLNKRIIFLNKIIEKLNLKNIEAIHLRVEEYARVNREKYDLVTARAVTNLNNLLEFSIPLVKENKYFIAMKGNNSEINTIKNCVNELDIQLIETKEFSLPNNSGIRNLIKFKKNKKTNIKYPRKYSEIKKKPL